MTTPSLQQRNGGSTSWAEITQAANQSRELPKGNVTNALMGTAPSSSTPTHRNPSGCLNHDATKESREFLKRSTRPCSITRSHLDAEGKLRRLLTYLENEPQNKGNGATTAREPPSAMTGKLLQL